MDEIKLNKIEEVTNSLGSSGISRKDFMKYTGGALAAAATFGIIGCEDDVVSPTPPGTDAVNLGTGDVGVLNYAYALEQLEAAFYIQVASSFYSGASDTEKFIFTEIRDHEIAHRDWFGAVIAAKAGMDKRIPLLTANFSSIDFSDRASVIGTAQLLEDTGVSAYNGAGHLLENTTYLLEAGKIVSVEARHASVIRSLTNPDSFYNNINDSGLDVAASPASVLAAAGGFIMEEIDASGLPEPADVYLN